MSATMIGTRDCGLASAFMVLYCHNDNILSIVRKVSVACAVLLREKWRAAPRSADPAGRLSGALLRALDRPAVFRNGQPEVFAQGLALVFPAKQPTALQFGNKQV